MPRGRSNDSGAGFGRYNLGASRSVGSWDDWTVQPELLYDAIASVLANGDAVLFGLTSDGGAIRVQLFSGSAKHSVYAADDAELDVILKAIRDSREH